MDLRTRDAFEALLLCEMVPALGRTQPSATALATAKARSVLGSEPEPVPVLCDGTIIKNAMSVIVPNSHGVAGIQMAAALGIVGGDPAARLDVLAEVTANEIERAQSRVESQSITVRLVEGIEGLDILAGVCGGADEATVELQNGDYRFRSITRDGEQLVDEAKAWAGRKDSDDDVARPELTMAAILAPVLSPLRGRTPGWAGRACAC